MMGASSYTRRSKAPGTWAIIRRADQVEVGVVVHRTMQNEGGGQRFSWIGQVGERLLGERSYLAEAAADVVAADLADRGGK